MYLAGQNEYDAKSENLLSRLISLADGSYPCDQDFLWVVWCAVRDPHLINHTCMCITDALDLLILRRNQSNQ